MLSKSEIKKEIKDIIEMIKTAFTSEELAAFKSFKSFYNEIDVFFAYEPEWKKQKNEEKFKEVYKILKGSGLK